jgi:drug/metabolite transporter (DMT)-like permease
LLFLIGSIILTSYLTLSFKFCEKLGIPAFQAIIFNYITCVVTGSIVNHRFPINAVAIQQPWFPWACVMGAMFITIFNILAFTAQRIGVAVASVANKLSLVIPFTFSLYLYNEDAGIIKMAGIVVAVVAVILTCYQPADKSTSKHTLSLQLRILVPLILFVSSGLLDTMIKYVEARFLDDANKNDYLVTAFASAATIGIVLLVTRAIFMKKKIFWQAIVAGICIGIPNYFSIWCLLKVLRIHAGNSSAIIPINNMGIVLFSTVAAYILFKEKLSPVNGLGIVLSMISIALISFG